MLLSGYRADCHRQHNSDRLYCLRLFFKMTVNNHPSTDVICAVFTKIEPDNILSLLNPMTKQMF